MKEFESMGLKPGLLTSLKRMGFTDATEVQEETIPLAMSGKDMVVRAKTGTGKTGAFLVPIINRISKEDYDAALIIVPTRELALQVTDVAKKMCSDSDLRVVTVYGGASMNVQINELRRRVNIIVGTPGRLIDLMKQRELRTDKIKFLVLDEADTMFDMGFIEDIEYIISQLPKDRQTMLFSATMPSIIVSIAKKYMRDPTRLSIGKEEEVTVTTIAHFYAIASGRQKLSTLLAYINQYKPRKAIIFSSTQRGADMIFRVLKKNNFDATIMHGGLSQARREYSLSDFRKGTQFLIATNVAARGLDITDVSDVINFDVSEDPAVYVHRVGRSARMGAEGRAFSIFSPRDRYLIGEIENSAKIKMTVLELDTSAYREAENLPEQLYERRESFGRGGYNQRGHRDFRTHKFGGHGTDDFETGQRKFGNSPSNQRGRFGDNNNRFGGQRNHRRFSSRNRFSSGNN